MLAWGYLPVPAQFTRWAKVHEQKDQEDGCRTIQVQSGRINSGSRLRAMRYESADTCRRKDDFGEAARLPSPAHFPHSHRP
jgi:hypothetical protein